MTEAMKSVPHPADAAKEELAEEARQVEDKAKGTKRDPESQFPAPEELEMPDYLANVGYFQVGVRLPTFDSGFQAIVTDPGARHAAAIDGFGSRSALRMARAYSAIAHGVEKLQLPAHRTISELVVTPGQLLPQPKDLVGEHDEAWDAYERELGEAMDRNSRLKREMKLAKDEEPLPGDEGYTPYPTEPKTQLFHLLSNLPLRTLERLVAGVGIAMLRFDEVPKATEGNFGGPSSPTP